MFDNATSAQALRPFLPAAGKARVIITSNEQSMREGCDLLVSHPYAVGNDHILAPGVKAI